MNTVGGAAAFSIVVHAVGHIAADAANDGFLIHFHLYPSLLLNSVPGRCRVYTASDLAMKEF